MKAILIDWNAYGNNELRLKLVKKGYDVILCPFNGHMSVSEKEKALSDFSEVAYTSHPAFVFSYHYFPEISNKCQELHIRYIAWIYDSPAFTLYSPTILNEVNRIFVFDRGVSDLFQSQGIKTVYHMPLGVQADQEHVSVDTFQCDLSFVGSMYDEPKHDLYRKFESVSPYTHGYLDAIIEAQKHIYGANILEDLITPNIEAEMQKAYPSNPDSVNAMTPAQIYSQFVLSRKVTAIERREILEMLGNSGLAVDLYTNNASLCIPGIRNHGPVEYGDKMSSVFASSKINLNITLRSILTGIPLRALDIMNAGGFLLSNYQEELCEYFIPGEDFDYYEDYNDLMAKVEYYLSHDRERCDMARSAQEKVRTEHTLSSRLDAMERYM